MEDDSKSIYGSKLYVKWERRHYTLIVLGYIVRWDGKWMDIIKENYFFKNKVFYYLQYDSFIFVSNFKSTFLSGFGKPVQIY